MRSFYALSAFFSQDEIDSLRIVTKNPDFAEGRFCNVPENALREVLPIEDHATGATIGAIKLADVILRSNREAALPHGQLLSVIASIMNLDAAVGNVLFDHLTETRLL